MINKNIYYVLALIVAGIIAILQGPINLELGKNLRSPIWATIYSMFSGAMLLLIIVFVTKQNIPSLKLFLKAPYWAYFGGVIGATILITLIMVIPKLGVGTTAIIYIVAQIITAMLIDHFGMFGYVAKPIDFVKIIGVLLMVSGIFLIKK